MYEYAEVWVWFSEEGLPGPRERLLVRRSLGQEPELKHHLAWAPAEVPLLKLAQVRETGGRSRRTSSRPRGSADWTSTRHADGSAGMTTRRYRCWPWPSWSSIECGWGKRVTDERAGGASPADASAGGAGVGRRRDPPVVGVASGTEPAGRRQPPKVAARRTTPARRKK